MISKKNLLVTCAALSFSLFSMEEEMHEMKLQGDSEGSIQIIDQELPLQTSLKSKKLWPYKMCPKPYKKWSLRDRCDTLVPSAYICASCIGGVEGVAWCISCDQYQTCAHAHEIAWCSKNMWFPCFCDSPQDTCVSIIANVKSVAFFSPVAAALCILAPWFKKGGLNCCERVPDGDELHTQSLELEEEK
jgi:hypothetical protein